MFRQIFTAAAAAVAFFAVFISFVPEADAIVCARGVYRSRPDQAEGEPRSVRRAATAAKAMRFKQCLAGYFTSCKVGCRRMGSYVAEALKGFDFDGALDLLERMGFR
jgi:hypothetical protein